MRDHTITRVRTVVNSFTNIIHYFIPAALVILLSLGWANNSMASHAAGADISYECLGNNDSFRVQVTFYRDCGGITAPGSVTIDVNSDSCGSSFSTTAPLVDSGEIIPYCPAETPTECGAGSNPSRQQYIYEDTIVLPSQCVDWTFSYDIFCRNSAITTISPTCVTLYTEATLDNTVVPCNSSPFFTNPPAPFVYDDETFCYNNGAVDLNGDSLVYELIIPKTGPGSGDTVNYVPPYNENQPLSSTPPLTIDSETGDICMTPTDSSEVTVVALRVKEYRFGKFVGSVIRDIQVNVIDGTDSLPYMDGIDGTNRYKDTIPAGCAYSFDVNTFDANPGDDLSLSSNASTAIPGSNFSSTGGMRPTGTFTWTPGAADVRSTPHCFTITVQDDACPVNGQEIRAFCLTVVDFSANFTMSNSTVCVGQEVNFYSQYDYTGFDYTWDFGDGANATFAQTKSKNPTSVSYLTSGAKTVTLTITNPNGCSVQESKVLTVNPSPTASFNHTAPICSDETVDFTNTGSSGAGVTYAWDFGSGASPGASFAENPSGIAYGSPGDKVVTQQVTNQHGCVSTATDTITVNSTPTADFTSTAPECTGNGVDFNNTGSSGGGLTYFWDFGSGATPATSTNQNPSGVTYSSPGIKTVTFAITDAGCSDTITKTINIDQSPTASFTTTAPVCEGAAVDFTNTGTSGPGWTYSWDFGSGATPSSSASQNPTGVTYNTPGTKVITFTITDGTCSSTDTNTITINDRPDAQFASTAPTCTGDTMSFVNTGSTSGGWSYDWDFGPGAAPATSTNENPQGIQYSTSGSKQVMFIISDANCADTAVQSVNIDQTPSVGFTSTAPQCAQSNIDFTNTGSSGFKWSYDWTFGSGAQPATSSSEDPAGIRYKSGGTKTVTLTITDGTCVNTDTGTINVYNLPPADAGRDTTVCNERTAQLGTPAVSGLTYSWTPTSTLNDPGIAQPTAKPEAAITHYHLVVTDTGTGCMNTDTVTVSMLSPLFANAGEDVEICRGDTVQIGAAQVEGQSYSWMPDTFLSDANASGPMAYPDSTMTFALMVVDTSPSKCDPIQDEVTVTVHQLPDADAGLALDTMTRGSSYQLTATGGVQYNWLPKEGLSNSAVFNPVATPDSTTTYEVIVVDVNGCVNTDSITLEVVDPDFFVPSAFTPNSNGKNDVFYVRSRGFSEYELTIFNRWGERVFHSEDPGEGWDGDHGVTDKKMPEGAYVYIVKGVLTNGTRIHDKGMVNLIR